MPKYPNQHEVRALRQLHGTHLEVQGLIRAGLQDTTGAQFLFGLRSQRPATAGVAGGRYYETDTDWTYLWTGVAWVWGWGLYVSSDADRLALSIAPVDAGALALSEAGGVYRLYRVDGAGAWVELPVAGSLTVEESDADPTETPVSKIIVPKNWQTEPATGTVRFKPRHALEFEFDGFGTVLTVSVDEAQVDELPWDCTIIKWRLAEASSTPIAATATVDVRKDSYANYPADAADSMTGTGTQPFLAGPQTKNEGSDFTGWTTTQFAQGDIPRAVLTAVTLAKKLRLVLTVEEL